jgi:mRNA-degrading endonuclease toxin of MazEF toxin-antitoxin module
VELPAAEAFHGRVLCDGITTLCDDDDATRVGALSSVAMAMVDAGLKAALDLD